MGIERMMRKGGEYRSGTATVRARYAAIAASCLLLAGMLTITAQQAASWVIRTMPHSAHFAARALRWGVNHVGMRPMSVLGFLGIGALLFWLRAGKLDGDLRELSRAARELADGVPVRPAQVLSSGELHELAQQLQRADRRMRELEGFELAGPVEEVKVYDSAQEHAYTPNRPRFGRRL
ncbi:hypothetical protein [Saccharibacillus sacchari]|uniref:hypothetical protein n=1 Tax=Saccharibacillus sacchari TaxID=456493 RepID=UPI0004B2B834|nr:hypothetical protein [Saccharibacillus sacchari]